MLSGKSSLLQALLLFVKGTKLVASSFFDPTQDITIELFLDELDETVLSALAEEHRSKIQELVENQSLRLMRRYQPDGSTSLRVIRNVPIEDRFSPDSYKPTFPKWHESKRTTTHDTKSAASTRAFS